MADESKSEVISENATNEAITNSPAKTDEKISNGDHKENDVTDPETIKKEANTLFLQGKRHFVIRDYSAAVASLAECCQLLSKVYDEQAEEMGDPYFYYGKALFEVARNESDVLGDQVEGGHNDEDDDDDEEEEEDEDEAEETKDTKETKETKETEVDDKEIKTENTETAANHIDENNANSDKEKEGETPESNEEINDLQLSWEYLELAKLIYLRKADECKDTAIKLSEVHLYLGENGLESESYGTAVEDMNECLKLQQKNLPPEDRRIAETYYHLGVAHSLSENFDEAITCFKSAIEQLERKIASLEKRKKNEEPKTEEEAKDAFYTMDGEIDEIKGIITDIKDKIVDMNDYKNQIKAELVRQVVSAGSGAGSSSADVSSQAGSSSSSASAVAAAAAPAPPVKPVSDISHLVRKKRKNENEESNNEKKSKTEDN